MQTKPENTNNHVARLLSGRWASGRSPNPGGRPKIIADVRDLARQHTRTALDTLVEIAVHGKTEIARICAANSLLDRGTEGPPSRSNCGNPTQSTSSNSSLTRSVTPESYSRPPSRSRIPTAAPARTPSLRHGFGLVSGARAETGLTNADDHG